MIMTITGLGATVTTTVTVIIIGGVSLRHAANGSIASLSDESGSVANEIGVSSNAGSVIGEIITISVRGDRNRSMWAEPMGSAHVLSV